MLLIDFHTLILGFFANAIDQIRLKSEQIIPG